MKNPVAETLFMNTVTIQKAVPEDLDPIRHLLSAENLPVIDLNPLLENFFLAVEKNGIVGVIGMDKYGNDGLLRSAVVQQAFRSTGIAAALINKLVDYAKDQAIINLYLITNTAASYFEKKGFVRITPEAVPAMVLQSKEFNGLCPAGSVIMHRKL